MIIRTSERNFTVLQVIHTSSEEEVSVCRDMEGGNTFTINRFPASGRGQEVLPLLARQMGNSAFEDYIRVFTQSGDIYGQFVHVDAPSLEHRLESQTIFLQERLAMASGLLERLVLMDMPHQMACNVLQEGNVLVDDTLTVRFRYALSAEMLCAPLGINDVSVALHQVLSRLFAVELSAQSARILEEFLETLAHKSYDSYLAIFAAYATVHEKMLQLIEEGGIHPKTFLFRLWEQIKRYFKLCKPVLIGLVLIAAFCYLIYTMIAPSDLQGTPVFFDEIGTVEIAPNSDLIETNIP